MAPSAPRVVTGTPACPACARPRPPQASECPFCGIVYARYRSREKPNGLPPTASARKGPSAAPSRIALPLRARERLLVSFAQGLEAGLGLEAIVQGPALGGFPRRLRETLLDTLSRGEAMSTSLALLGILDPPDAALLAAGEQQGKMPEAYRVLAERIRDAISARRRLISLLIYPTLLLAASFVIAPVPRLVTEGVAAYTLAALPPLLALLAAVALAMVVGPRLHAGPPVRRAIGAVTARLPPLSFVVRARSVAAFCRTLGASLSAGLPARQSLALALDTSAHPAFRNPAADILGRLDDGATLADAVRVAGLLDAAELASIGHGEIAGKLDEVLPAIAEERTRQARVLTLGLIAVAGFGVFALVVGQIVRTVIATFGEYLEMLEGLEGLIGR